MAMTPIRFRTLVDRAGQHCQCDADEPYGCGKTHPTTGDRCYESGDWRAPSSSSPATPTSRCTRPSGCSTRSSS